MTSTMGKTMGEIIEKNFKLGIFTREEANAVATSFAATATEVIDLEFDPEFRFEEEALYLTLNEVWCTGSSVWTPTTKAEYVRRLRYCEPERRAMGAMLAGSSEHEENGVAYFTAFRFDEEGIFGEPGYYARLMTDEEFVIEFGC